MQEKNLKIFEIFFWIKGLDEKGVPLHWAREAYNEEDLQERVSQEVGGRKIIVKSIKELA